MTALPRVIELIDLSYDVYYGTKDPKKLKRSTSLIQAVYDASTIIAATLCRGIEDSHKISAICCDQTEKGKDALRFIIKDNICYFKNWVWGEVSEAIEHYYKKFNGYPIPNAYAAMLLGKPQEAIILDDDGFHYTRRIGDSEPMRKVIFGFRDDELMKKVMDNVDYSMLREKFNLSDEVLESSKYPHDVKWASAFINQLSDLYDDKEIGELSPQLKEHLEQAIAILKEYGEKKPWAKRESELGEFLLDDIPSMLMGRVE